MDIPEFWKSDLDTVEALAKGARVGEVRVLTQSAGGRNVYCFAYGARQALVSRANYSSACGAHDRNAYAPLAGKKRVLLLIGAEHGQETEGTAALTNLISILERGVDFAGQGNESLLRAAEGVRLLIVPVANPDGRARVRPDSMLGHTADELRYWGQGTWRDGTLCGWPGCKRIHPIKEAAGFLGGYFNDDGVNLMHDNFFHPMARETQALLDLAAEEFVDCALHLHGGSNSLNDLLQTNYATREVGEAIRALAVACNGRGEPEGLPFTVREPVGKEAGETPPSFNLPSAMHHACGCVSAVFESNECLSDQGGPHLTHEQVYRSHMILFETAMALCAGRQP